MVPVLVIIKADDCPLCVNLTRNWPAISLEIRRAVPGIRIFTVELVRRDDPLDYTKVPIALGNYREWVPMILMVPGPVWDDAMRDKNTRNLRDTQVMNGKLSGNGAYIAGNRWDISDPYEFAAWVKDAYLTIREGDWSAQDQWGDSTDIVSPLARPIGSRPVEQSGGDEQRERSRLSVGAPPTGGMRPIGEGDFSIIPY